MHLNDILRRMVKASASDLFLKVGSPPAMRIDGRIRFLQAEAITPEQSKEMLETIFKAKRRKNLTLHREQDLSYDVPGIGRFRCNISRQRGHIFFVLRVIQRAEMTFEELHLPVEPMKRLAELDRGLVLVTGTTGSGKSTTLAGIINYINQSANKHIVTVEDPIEYIYKDKRSIVTQREIGADTESFASALKYALRQAPDVILIGEIRDRETMEHALAFADTGHLAISTLHANNANQALDRIINFFPEERRPQLLNDLGNNLKAFVSQRLVKTIDGKRRAAVEVMLGTPTVRDLIKRNEFSELKEIMEKSKNLGMQTFDQALIDLVHDGAIDEEEAVKNADSANNVRLKLKLYRDNPANAKPAPVAAAPVAAPAAAPKVAEAGDWGLELKLEDIEEEQPPEDPGRQGI